jgi:predicted pyridoxine 5'-phosphate oxidase superfamily flavin-nucleotide-binding protein
MDPFDIGDTGSQRSPWHLGELALQAKAGVVERMDEVGRRVVRDYMPDQHREFFGRLPFLVVGAVDDKGAPWTTLLTGMPGFIHSPDPRTLSVAARLNPLDPGQASLTEGAAVGLLGIEMHTKRRNRMNGDVRIRDDGFGVAVRRSFGNCPQYITARDNQFANAATGARAGEVEVLSGLDEEARRTIGRADTFFVSSYADRAKGREVDASHRGGPEGFVRLDTDMLVIPDYRGNFHFATLGNILLNGQAGLSFVDFATGDLLQLSGRAEISFGQDAEDGQGFDRKWQFFPERGVRRRAALPLRWKRQLDASPSPPGQR